MRKLVWMQFLIGLMFLLSVGTSFSETYLHPETGMIFPDHLAGMNKMKVTDFEKEHPGLTRLSGFEGYVDQKSFNIKWCL